jgi:hypothetical protein
VARRAAQLVNSPPTSHQCPSVRARHPD